MIKVCGTRCVRHHSSLLHFTLGLFGPCHNKSHNGQAGIAGCSCQGYRCPAGRHHYSSRPAAPASGRSRRLSALLLLLEVPLAPLAFTFVLLFPLPRERGKKKRNPQNKSHQIGREKGNKIVHVRRQNKDFKILSSAGLPVVKV